MNVSQTNNFGQQAFIIKSKAGSVQKPIQRPYSDSKNVYSAPNNVDEKQAQSLSAIKAQKHDD